MHPGYYEGFEDIVGTHGGYVSGISFSIGTIGKQHCGIFYETNCIPTDAGESFRCIGRDRSHGLAARSGNY